MNLLLRRTKSVLPMTLSSLGAIIAALLVGAIVIIISGQNPVKAYTALIQGAFVGRRAITETLVAATPLILGGLAFAIAARAGLFNIGIEGQMIVGGLAAGLVGAAGFGLPIYLYLPLALIAGMIAGGIWGAIPGYLKAKSGAHEVISTIMLNYLAMRLSAWVVRSDDIFPVRPGLQATDTVAKAAQLPRLIDRTRLHAGFIIALAAAAILGYLLFRTTIGYKIRVVGQSRGASDYGGINWGRTLTLAMLMSGLLGGLAGAGQVLGLQHRYYDVSPGYGFTSIAVGLVGLNHPVGVVLAGFLFGILSSGSLKMQAVAGTSKDLVQVLQGLVILAVAAFATANRLLARRRATRQLKQQPSMSSSQAAAVGMEPDLEVRSGPPAV